MKCYKFISLLVVFFTMTIVAHAQSTPCSGSEYTTNAEFFRAYASALSSDATASKKKAETSARSAIASLINAKAEAAAKLQSKIAGADMTQLVELIRMATQQEVANMKTICENSEQVGGKFKTHMVVEVSKAKVLGNIIKEAKKDDKLKAKFEEGKFKQAF